MKQVSKFLLFYSSLSFCLPFTLNLLYLVQNVQHQKHLSTLSGPASMIALVSTVLWTVPMTMILTILSNLTISVDRTLSTFGISKQTTILTAKRRTAPVRFSQFIYRFKAMNLLLSQFRCLPFNRNHVFMSCRNTGWK